MCLVVGEQRAKRLILERLELRELLGREDQPVNAKRVEIRDPATAIQASTERQRLPGFLVGAANSLDAMRRTADADRDDFRESLRLERRGQLIADRFGDRGRVLRIGGWPDHLGGGIADTPEHVQLQRSLRVAQAFLQRMPATLPRARRAALRRVDSCVDRAELLVEVVAESLRLLRERDLAAERAVEHLVEDIQLDLAANALGGMLPGERDGARRGRA